VNSANENEHADGALKITFSSVKIKSWGNSEDGIRNRKSNNIHSKEMIFVIEVFFNLHLFTLFINIKFHYFQCNFFVEN